MKVPFAVQSAIDFTARLVLCNDTFPIIRRNEVPQNLGGRGLECFLSETVRHVCLIQRTHCLVLSTFISSWFYRSLTCSLAAPSRPFEPDILESLQKLPYCKESISHWFYRSLTCPVAAPSRSSERRDFARTLHGLGKWWQDGSALRVSHWRIHQGCLQDAGCATYSHHTCSLDVHVPHHSMFTFLARALR